MTDNRFKFPRLRNSANVEVRARVATGGENQGVKLSLGRKKAGIFVRSGVLAEVLFTDGTSRTDTGSSTNWFGEQISQGFDSLSMNGEI